MANDRTPSTDELRDIFTWDRCVRHGRDESLDTRIFRDAFDRWLAAHDAEVRAQALRLAAHEVSLWNECYSQFNIQNVVDFIGTLANREAEGGTR